MAWPPRRAPNSLGEVARSAPRLPVRLAHALRRERARIGWTQERAAEAARMNPRHYQKLEEGSVNATLHTLERLCKAFRIDVIALFDLEERGA